MTLSIAKSSVVYDVAFTNYPLVYSNQTSPLFLGSGMLEASQVLGFDVDADALDVCSNNIEEFEMASSIDLVNMDIVKEEQAMKYLKRRRVIDTVIMNPPFGTKNNKGMIYLFI